MPLLDRYTRLGLIVAFIALVLDRISKFWVLEVINLDQIGRMDVLPVFSLTMVWNRGISLGLFNNGGETGRIILISLTIAVTLLLLWWLVRTQDRLLSVALGLIVGGSVGNIWDRLEFGAVADFMHFHVGTASFYVFNVADSAITIGVILLMADALLSPQNSPKKTSAENDAHHD